jgi:hypothetical protein
MEKIGKRIIKKDRFYLADIKNKQESNTDDQLNY